MTMKSEELLDSLFSVNNEFCFEPDESLDIDISACSVIPSIILPNCFGPYHDDPLTGSLNEMSASNVNEPFLYPETTKEFNLKPKKSINKLFEEVSSELKKEQEDRNVCDEPKTKIEYVCDNCKALFFSRIDFDTHYKTTYHKTPLYTCNICDKQMENIRSYRGHYQRHLTNKFQCSICPKKFSTQILLNEHSTIHTNDVRHICKECALSFLDYTDLKEHIREHKQVASKKKTTDLKWKCMDCGKLLMNRSSLAMHVKIHKDRKYECSICPLKFVQKINLSNHIKSHTGDKPYLCNECGKSFVGKPQLVRHQAHHFDGRPFKCDICEKMYKSERQLKVHQMIHKKQRPHACSHCAKTFLSSSKLKQHYNIHTGARPFKCKYCSKDFTNFPNWLKHIRRRHKVNHKTGEQLEKLPNFLIKVKKEPMPEPPATLQAINEIELNGNESFMKYEDILPLNTSDDVARATNILMQQTLDIEDNLQQNLFQKNTPPTIDINLFNYIQSNNEVPPATSINNTEFNSLQFETFSTAYPPSLFSMQDQCNNASTLCMRPLPPITTMKNKHMLIDHSAQIFSTDVL